MKKLNVIIVYNKEEDRILMCKREKEPYKGKFNLVGGKVEENEDELHAAYRELQEETGITNKDIYLTHIMNFQYEISDIELEVYAGKLNKDINLVEEVNKLYWMDKKENYRFELKEGMYRDMTKINDNFRRLGIDVEKI